MPILMTSSELTGCGKMPQILKAVTHSFRPRRMIIGVYARAEFVKISEGLAYFIKFLATLARGIAVVPSRERVRLS
jgi:hypothetical protein